ncbi:hypothetical protein AB0K18_42070 [Nonomuraea sp. NPDC049421]|uniref:hypothetical protein n=1 Tax=Nonomuraea sp. NPDC049421 TaxID=3155275 RepID=UPI0034339B68
MHQVEEALDLARGLLDEDSSSAPQVTQLPLLMRRYSAIKFDVPDTSDADG